ncbi:MAG: hypothetical protein O9327_02575 [Polaromonas sp.]|nr:hypothetical protein [Polaromonas sp.]
MRTDDPTTDAVVAMDQRRVLVGFGEMGSAENFLLGVWTGASVSDDDACLQAREALWDYRLEVAGCAPRFVVTNLSRVMGLDFGAMVNVAEAGMSVTTLSGRRLVLSPVPSARLPSEDSSTWLRFIEGFHPDGALSPGQAARVQMFMRAHKTEALTDGESFLTLGGDHLALCDPRVAQSPAH